MANAISVDEAIARIHRELSPLDPVNRRVTADLLHSICVSDIHALASSPRFDCAAMDGFAVRSRETQTASLTQPAQFRVAPDIPAQGQLKALLPGEAAPISTGAPVPTGADCIIPREACHSDGLALTVSQPAGPAANVRRRGEDWQEGAKLIAAGAMLESDMIGALLSCGVQEVSVRGPLGIRIVPTGSELATDGNASPSVRLDSNGPMIAASCRSLGIRTWLEAPVPDDEAALADSLFLRTSQEETHILITIGGMSAGNHDLVRDVLERHRARIAFHGVAMRPGKPLLFAILPDGRPFFGLPGNPVASSVGFRFFVMAAIRRLLGVPPESGFPTEISTPPRERCTLLLRGKKSDRSDRGIEAIADQRSHVMRSLVEADCWIKLDPAETGGVATRYEKHVHLR
jgi:molybdopterin molybdotransferase